jgi:hypothetical protein
MSSMPGTLAAWMRVNEWSTSSVNSSTPATKVVWFSRRFLHTTPRHSAASGTAGHSRSCRYEVTLLPIRMALWKVWLFSYPSSTLQLYLV